MQFETTYSKEDSIFILLLPAEIRTIIYSLVLAPTGRITTKPNDPFESDQPPLILYPSVWPYHPINLSITRTCRQMHKESRGVFWQWNTLVLTTEHLCSPSFVNGLFTSWGQLRRVELQFGLAVADIESVLWILQPLEVLSRRGKLQEVFFSVCGIGTMSKFGAALIPSISNTNKSITKMTDLYDLLHSASDPRHGHLTHLKRSLDLKIGMELSSSKARKEWFRTYSPRLCEEALAMIHTILRGDVALDGVLCYRDGTRLRETFRSLEEENEDEGGVDLTLI